MGKDLITNGLMISDDKEPGKKWSNKIEYSEKCSDNEGTDGKGSNKKWSNKKEYNKKVSNKNRCNEKGSTENNLRRKDLMRKDLVRFELATRITCVTFLFFGYRVLLGSILLCDTTSMVTCQIINTSKIYYWPSFYRKTTYIIGMTLKRSIPISIHSTKCTHTHTFIHKHTQTHVYRSVSVYLCMCIVTFSTELLFKFKHQRFILALKYLVILKFLSVNISKASS